MYVNNSGNFGVNWYGTSTALASAAINANTWYHLVVTFENTTVKGYINGVLVNTATYASATTDSANDMLSIAQRNTGATSGIGNRAQCTNGYLTHVRLYNYVLSQDEITVLSQELTPTP